MKMRFEKVSLEQYMNDYLKAVGKNPEEELSEEDAREIIKIYSDIKLPERGTKYSAGYDFFLPYSIKFTRKKPTLIPTGIRFKCDNDKYLECVPRSGLGFKYGMALINTIGVIDSDYYESSNEGHIMAKVTCLEDFDLDKGKGFMQGIISKYYLVDDDNSEGVRDGGFGSTGA